MVAESVDSEVFVMENVMSVLSYFFSSNCDSFRVIFGDYLGCLNDVGDNFREFILLDLICGTFLFIFLFVWDLDLSGVWNRMLNDIWNIDGDLICFLIVNCHCEFLLDVINFLFILCHFDLGGDDIWDLLPHCVINSFCGLIGHFDVVLVGNLVDDLVWHWRSNNIWYLVSDNVRFLLADGVRYMFLDLKWHLPLNSIRDLFFDLVRHLSFNFVFLLHNGSDGDLIWHLCGDSEWYLLCNLVLFCNVVGDNVVMGII